ncbi:hypothetical protein NDU88_005426 [Pleurodeles waltl]|uniref:Uncharacterized protein n=1 Tax=Pleurodeles waltl TaxID=8319 RepID=A0AAV7PFX0_PLEWA|nr:hypothetical protein NDU88_005426 [Pleurodeles waltl]
MSPYHLHQMLNSEFRFEAAEATRDRCGAGFSSPAPQLAVSRANPVGCVDTLYVYVNEGPTAQQLPHWARSHRGPHGGTRDAMCLAQAESQSDPPVPAPENNPTCGVSPFQVSVFPTEGCARVEIRNRGTRDCPDTSRGNSKVKKETLTRFCSPGGR